MDVIASYPSSSPVPNDIASVPATLTTTEADIFVHKHPGSLKASQLTIYLQVTLGGVASATFYYYYSPNVSAASPTWYPLSILNTSTNELIQRSSVLDGNTYATGGVSQSIDDIALGGCVGFKVTGKSASGTPTVAVTVMSRFN